MGDVKRSISALCRALKLAGFSNLAAEEVRQAKFNKLATVDKLWRSLHAITILVRDSWDFSEGEIGICDCPQHRLLDEHEPDLTCEQSSLIIRHVVSSLRQLGFGKTPFWGALEWAGDVAVDQSADSGTGHSRILLIALCWLLGEYSVGECIIRWLDREVSSTAVEHHHYSRADTSPRARTAARDDAISRDALRQLVASVGRLRCAGRALRSLNEDRARLCHRVLSCLQADGSAAVASPQAARSAQDVLLLASRRKLDRACAALAKANTVMAHVVAWRGAEDRFWQWAESVVNEELAAPTAGASSPGSAPPDGAGADGRLLRLRRARPSPCVPLYRKPAKQEKRPAVASGEQASALRAYSTGLLCEVHGVRGLEMNVEAMARAVVKRAVARDKSLVLLR